MSHCELHPFLDDNFTEDIQQLEFHSQRTPRASDSRGPIAVAILTMADAVLSA
jgi:hypothetical protein